MKKTKLRLFLLLLSAFHFSLFTLSAATNTNIVVSSSATLTGLTAQVTALQASITNGSITVNGVPLAQLGLTTNTVQGWIASSNAAITLAGLAAGNVLPITLNATNIYQLTMQKLGQYATAGKMYIGDSGMMVFNGAEGNAGQSNAHVSITRDAGVIHLFRNVQWNAAITNWEKIDSSDTMQGIEVGQEGFWIDVASATETQLVSTARWWANGVHTNGTEHGVDLGHGLYGLQVRRNTNTVAGSGSYINIGQSPALTGTLRGEISGSFRLRNAAGTADIYIAGTDQSDNLYIGDSTTQTPKSINLQTTGLVHVVASGLTLGASPATLGNIRFSSGNSLVGLNSDGVNNVDLLALSTGNEIIIGNYTARIPAAIYLETTGTLSFTWGGYTNLVPTTIITNNPADFVRSDVGITNGQSGVTLYSTNMAPTAAELASAGWARSLLANGRFLYLSTNLTPTMGTTNTVSGDTIHEYATTPQQPFIRTWTLAATTAIQRQGGSTITNVMGTISGPIVVNTVLGLTTGGFPVPTVSISCEAYWTTNAAAPYTWTQLGASGYQTMQTVGTTNGYCFVIPFAQITFPTATPATLLRVYAIKESATGREPTLVVVGGTNAVLAAGESISYNSSSASALPSGTITNATGSAAIYDVWAGAATNQTSTNAGTLYFTW
jgi:hypothetical protein